MTAYQLTVIQPGDIETISVICECGARISVHYAKHVEKCPSCHRELDKAAQEALLKFQQFQDLVKVTKTRFEFAIQQPHHGA